RIGAVAAPHAVGAGAAANRIGPVAAIDRVVAELAEQRIVGIAGAKPEQRVVARIAPDFVIVAGRAEDRIVAGLAPNAVTQIGGVVAAIDIVVAFAGNDQIAPAGAVYRDVPRVA